MEALVAARLDCEAASLALEFPDGDIVAGTIELGEPVETVFFGRSCIRPLRAGGLGRVRSRGGRGSTCAS